MADARSCLAAESMESDVEISRLERFPLYFILELYLLRCNRIDWLMSFFALACCVFVSVCVTRRVSFGVRETLTMRSILSSNGPESFRW